MSVTINKVNNVYNIEAKDMQEGAAYMDLAGDVYICNPCISDGIQAFSVCGRCIVPSGASSLRFREVDLEIFVK